MCGIFGVIGKGKNVDIETIKNLAIFNETRGSDSSGILTLYSNGASSLIKGNIPVKKLLNSLEYKKQSKQGDKQSAVFGHTRLVTNGNQIIQENNQPAEYEGVYVFHNGIITNEKELRESFSLDEVNVDLDSVIIAQAMAKYLTKQWSKIELDCFLSNVKGTLNFSCVSPELGILHLYTNCGSLYYVRDQEQFLFSSEASHLKKLNCRQLEKDNLMTVDLCFVKNGGTEVSLLEDKTERLNTISDPLFFRNHNNSEYTRVFEARRRDVSRLKRCSKCVLPETFPHITFDSKGVCSFCNARNRKDSDDWESKERTFREMCKRRSTVVNGFGQNIVVPLSGGRDSCFALHYLVEECGLTPVTITYDWGMVTDLARRNIARMCGSLGVENIIIAADISRKRQYVRKNLLAWLRKPDLGMIPILMAGDKYFFKHVNTVKGNTGIDFNVWGINDLENTEFKIGYNGVKPNFSKKNIYDLDHSQKLKLAGSMLSNVAQNPWYINSSIIDNVGGFISRYGLPKTDYHHLFDYVKWDEKVIEQTLVNNYDWELASDTKSSWRIGDGTASFYNYVYYMFGGFTENDTFRSNQIRNGDITREFALAKLEEENAPRWDTMRWYFNILNVDFDEAINITNHVSNKYSVKWSE